MEDMEKKKRRMKKKKKKKDEKGNTPFVEGEGRELGAVVFLSRGNWWVETLAAAFKTMLFLWSNSRLSQTCIKLAVMYWWQVHYEKCYSFDKDIFLYVIFICINDWQIHVLEFGLQDYHLLLSLYLHVVC